MGTEDNALIVAPTRDEIVAMYAAYTEEKPDEAEARVASNVKEDILVPTIKISKDTTDLTIKVGESTALVQKIIYATFFDVFATRALWAPKKYENEFKVPVCSHGYTDPKTFDPANDRGIGNFVMNQHLGPPVDLDTNIKYRNGDKCNVPCNSCPWNKFESAGTWDDSKRDSKAKACNESRVLFGMLAVKIPGAQIPTTDGSEVFMYQHDARVAHPVIGPMVAIHLGMGSNRKAVQNMAAAAQARGVPFKACVWKLTVKHSEGNQKFAILVPEFAGLLHKRTFDEVAKPQQIKVAEFVKRNSDALVSDSDAGF